MAATAPTASAARPHNALDADAGVLACILTSLSSPSGWARLLCVSRDLQLQVLRVLTRTPVAVTIDCSVRSPWRAQLAATAKWCRCVTSLSLLHGSPRSLGSLQLLQPCLQPHMTQLTLRGFKLDSGDCHARHLVSWLLQHCPQLQHLDLQGCDLPALDVFQQLQQLAPGLRVLQLTGARLAKSSDSCGAVGPSRVLAPAAASSGLQELHVGCYSDLSLHQAWLSNSSSVTSRDLVQLLLATGGSAALRVLDVSHRPSVDDALLAHLAAHPPRQLHTLDVSLTRVTARGLVQLLQHCRGLRVLKYCCRCGEDGLDSQLLYQLTAALPHLQELDLSLHADLDDAGLAALSECPQLRKLTLARSHKFSGTALEKVVRQLPNLQELEVVRCRGVGQASLKRLAAAYPTRLRVEG